MTDDFIGRLATDAKEGRFFVGLSADSKVRVRQHVVDFLCMATGGPCKYTGRDMETSHTGLNITEEDWNVSVKALTDTFKQVQGARPRTGRSDQCNPRAEEQDCG